jgi:hypothetical protein
MSRITLTTYPDGKAHLVVGWDHPAGGAFWKEYATAAEVEAAEEKVAEWEDKAADGEQDQPFPYATELLAETEVKREGGMWPGLPLPIKQHIPDDLKLLISDEVETLLLSHAENPESGRINITLNTLKEN